MEVGIRQLKNGLSRYVRRARAGDEFVVTDHGRPVARLVPFGEPTTIERLIADGRITEAGLRKVPIPEMPAPVKAHGITPEDLKREIDAGRGR